MRGLSTSRMFWVSRRPPRFVILIVLSYGSRDRKTINITNVLGVSAPPSFCVFSGNKSLLFAPHAHPLPANLPGQRRFLFPCSQFCPAAQLRPTSTPRL